MFAALASAELADECEFLLEGLINDSKGRLERLLKRKGYFFSTPGEELLEFCLMAGKDTLAFIGKERTF